MEVFSADQLLARLEVQNVVNPGIGTWWHLFALDGATQALTVVNQLSNSAPLSSGVSGAPKVGQR